MSDLRLGIVFDVRSGRFRPEVQQNTRLVQGFGNSTQRTAGQTRQLSAALDNTNHNLIATNRVAQSVTRAIVGLAAGFGAIQLGTGLVKELAAFQDIRTRLQGLSDSAADYAAKERWLIELAGEHHKELNGLADGYSRLSTLTQEKIINDGQARDMLEGLSNAAAQNGASTADLERVYYGLAQALGQGVVQMQEVNQVVEPLPGLMTKLARAAGEETGAGFKALIASGKVTSEVFGGLLVTALKEYEGAAAKTADNINAKYRDIKLEYQLLAVELEQPINSALLPTLDGLVSGLSLLKEHTNGVIIVLQGGLLVATGHVIKAIYAKTVAMRSAVVANTAVLNANVATARSEISLAISANARAVSERAAASISLAMTSSTIARVRATNNLAIANTQVMATERALIASRTALTVATRAASITTRALSGSMALLGGPAGVIMLAGFALYSYATSSDEASSKTKLLATDVENLTQKYKTLAVTKLRVHLLDVNNALEAQKNKLNTLKSTIEDTGKSSSSSGLYDTAQIKSYIGLETISKEGKEKTTRAIDQQADANKLLNQQKALQLKLIKQIAFLDGGGKPEADKKSTTKPKQDTKILAVFTQQRDALSQRLALLGKTNELAKAEYATTMGKYKDLLPAQKSVILNLAKEIDTKNKSMAADVAANNQAKQLSDTANSYAETLQRKISLTSDVTNVQQLAYDLEHGNLVGINDQLKEQLIIKAQLADQAVADAEKQLPFWEQMNEHIASTTQNFDTMWGNTFDRFAQGIGDATATSIMEGQNFGDAMKNIGKSVISQVISGIVQIGVKKLALSIIERGINKTAAISGGGAMLAGAQASSLTAGINAFAATAAIPIVGPAMAPAAMVAALAITTPMVAGVAGMVGAMAGMAHDGIDEIPSEGTWLLDKGERVVDSRTNQDLKQALKSGNNLGGSKVTVNLIEDASKAGQVSQSKGLNNEDVIRIFVADIRQGGDSSDAMELTYGLQRAGT
jgi:tape measure domain-containing protein